MNHPSNSLLSIAVLSSPDEVRAILADDPGAIFERTPENAWSPLHWLPFSPGRTAAVAQLLVDAGLNVNTRDNEGVGPLQQACRFDDRPLVRALIDLGADINAQDKNGHTPLHDAQSPEVAIFLLEAGADSRLREREGMTPLKYARACGAKPISRAIKSFLDIQKTKTGKT